MTSNNLPIHMLFCPQSKSTLVQDGERLISVNPQSRLAYAIKDNIPVMLVDEATTLSVEEWETVMQKQGRNLQTGEII
ncbi:hypothetical protein MNBD_PLANCTO02-258 [hydrothermal vent metagenome]|uniref:Uncharacterized protein n=1 Tax=hydrothermal vent metagenome TaxID=652676 RepID=A0A3B1DPZ4_9ZZZZ